MPDEGSRVSSDWIAFWSSLFPEFRQEIADGVAPVRKFMRIMYLARPRIEYVGKSRT